MAAAPTPWAPRATSSASPELAAPQAAESSVKASRPAAKIARRPIRSASAPAVSSVAARVSA